MKAASISELKQELSTLRPKQLLDICLRLTKYKKENKELLNYLLFEAHDPQGYVQQIVSEIDEAFNELPAMQWYLTKKGLRKILRQITKYSKHIATKEAEADMLLCFCKNLQQYKPHFNRNKAFQQLYDSQIKKLSSIIEQVHEDLRFDYEREMKAL